MLSNMALLSTLESFLKNCPGTIRVLQLATPGAVPPQLAPTVLQQNTPHKSWIDCFPLAAMRDNLIKYQESYNQDEWCADILGTLFDNHRGGDLCGFIAWTEPWDISGWEISKGFARKYGRLLKSCGELVESTNQRRMMRHEEPLVIDLS